MTSTRLYISELGNGRMDRVEFAGGYFSLINDSTGYADISARSYVLDYLGSVRAVCDGESGKLLESIDYMPSGLVFGRMNHDMPHRRFFCGKEELPLTELKLYDSTARLQDAYIPRFTTMDPLAEKYYHISPYNYGANNPVNMIDPDGKETRVVQNEDGTYRIIGGVLNKDRNIYVYTQDKNGNYTIRGNSIGITTSTTSFYNADANGGKGAWAIGSIINPNDKSGDNFLGNIFGNTPTMIDDYMANAGNGGKYDFKVTNGTDEPIPGIDTYRGMPIGETKNGQTIFSSARDIGNIAAGYVAGANGISWEASRIAFDTYQSKVNRRPSIESISTRNAEYYGWRIGSNIRNNTPVQKANNLLRSIWRWITK